MTCQNRRLRPCRTRRNSRLRRSRQEPRAEATQRVRRHRRRARALARADHRGRQGADAPALRELPSGHRAPAARREHAAAPAACRARARQPRRAGHALRRLATASPITTQAACRGTRSGMWRRSRWLGRARALGEICEQIKDPARNGRKDMARLIHHMAEDSLVGWGWNPGAGREPAPGTQKIFGDLIKAWAETGAACPRAGTP